MSDIDFSQFAPKLRQPTKKEKARYQRWVAYLSDSRLSKKEIHNRAAKYASMGKEPTEV